MNNYKCHWCKKQYQAEYLEVHWCNWAGKEGRGCDYNHPKCEECTDKPRITLDEQERADQEAKIALLFEGKDKWKILRPGTSSAQ
jgi:hypothetical protein